MRVYGHFKHNTRVLKCIFSPIQYWNLKLNQTKVIIHFYTIIITTVIVWHTYTPTQSQKARNPCAVCLGS